MPTYLCFSQPGTLSAEQRADLATRITAIHTEATGAPLSFTQLVFQDVSAASHFIGGQPADHRTVWVYGHIRDGRTPEAKNALVLGIRENVCAATGIDPQHVWVYLNELGAAEMVEFGHVLPVHGQEDVWMQSLPNELRDRLRSFESATAS
ncbi:tautomerase family protein [Amycolatopsis nivea]|uniref:tautomerase family protein n=1 Tax=Amycolatopsis nivea TaxID=1644109 RepID=UPI00106F69E7|nr:tautomerase family protein [Amycolatopsis nivea]